MIGLLNENQIEYVLYHLNFNFRVSPEIRDRMIFLNTNSGQSFEAGNIVFKLSEDAYLEEKKLLINDVPVLFPIQNKSEFYSWENGSLIFHHDIFKSAFFLLSGYQETLRKERDIINRFPYQESIQQKLGIVNRPVVNYYFKYIEEGVKAFCDDQGIPFRQNRLFDDVGFMLTHDVDVVDTYTSHDLVFKAKQVFGISPRYSLTKSIRYFWKYLINYLKIFNRPNPHWDFEYLVAAAKRFGYKSVFYFLHKDLKHKDSYYSFGDKRIRKLFKYLSDEGCEIGLHGSTRSSDNIEVLKDHYQKLKHFSGQGVSGIRQHRLIHLQATTAQLHVECGLLYDASLGFAEHEGFRNSFCYPFKLYDFQRDEMLDLWEIPLIVMDATLYMYRNMTARESLKCIKELVDETKKFNGIFTLLWHNGNFDEENYPGGRQLFENILAYLKEKNCESVTGVDCIKSIVIPIFENE